MVAHANANEKELTRINPDKNEYGTFLAQDRRQVFRTDVMEALWRLLQNIWHRNGQVSLSS